MQRLATAMLALLVAFGASGCGLRIGGDLPIAIGCERRQGNGPRDEGIDPPGIPLDGISGLHPAQAFAAAAQQGHVVVFRLDNMTCICLPPVGYGAVTEGWWGSNGVLWLDLEGVEPQGVKPPNNSGC